MSIEWKRPDYSGVQSVDEYIAGCMKIHSETLKLLEDTAPVYKIHTTYLETASGAPCKAISIKVDDEDRLDNGFLVSIPDEYQACAEEMKRLSKLDADITSLGLDFVNANLGLAELGLRAITYGKALKSCRQMVKECDALVKAMTEEKRAELATFETWLANASVIDGISGTRYTVLNPLMPTETPPTDQLQLLSNFTIK